VLEALWTKSTRKYVFASQVVFNMNEI